MKAIALLGLSFFLVLSDGVWAEQAGEGQKASPMQGMMQEMMKGEKDSEGGMQGMMQMMQMMRMMNQCAAMMESAPHSSKETKETPNR